MEMTQWHPDCITIHLMVNELKELALLHLVGGWEEEWNFNFLGMDHPHWGL